jgi:acyl-CoA thioesterase YciA
MTTANQNPAHPEGHLLLRTVAMPADTNPNGDIFGGWIMAQMDIAGGVMAKEIAQGRVVTIAVNAMKFIQPVKVGDVVACYGTLTHTGTTSLTIHLQTWVKPAWRAPEVGLFQVTEADFVYVAIDDHGVKRPLNLKAE